MEACWSTQPTFGHLADVFVERVLVSGKCFKRVDVTFDRYIDNSTKSGAIADCNASKAEETQVCKSTTLLQES